MYQNQIKEIRIGKGMTLVQLANLSNVSSGYLCHLENGTRQNPSIIIMEQISKALGKTVAEIFFK